MNLKYRLAKLEKHSNELKQFIDIDLTALSDEELNELEKQLNKKYAKTVGQKEADESSNWIATLSDRELDKLESILKGLQSNPQKPLITTKELQRLML